VSVARRIDCYDDPSADLVPAVNVIVASDAGEILLIRRSDNGNWAVPGGAIDLGESVAQAAVRETLEESGITCELTGLVGIYSDPRHVILYTSNGEVRQEFSIVLTARPVSGTTTYAATRAPWWLRTLSRSAESVKRAQMFNVRGMPGHISSGAAMVSRICLPRCEPPACRHGG
jgi:ADP-ribose pyrophosphatase YjhB (NUDIX family)